MQTKSDYRGRNKWIVLICSIGINLTMCVNYSWSVIKKVLVRDWNWSNLEASWPYTAYTAAFAFTMALSGRFQDRYGPRVAAIVGGVLLGTGYIVSSFMNSPLSLAIAYGLLCSIGNSLCYATTTPSSLKWFPPERRGLITGLVISGVGIAAVYGAPLVNRLLATHGLATTFLIIGVFSSMIIIVMAQFLNVPSSDYLHRVTSDISSTGLAEEISIKEYDWREMIKTPQFYKLWFMFALAASAGLMVTGHIASISKSQADWENGYYLVSIFALFNTGGRIGAGYLSDKFGRVRIMLLVFLLQASNLLLFNRYVVPITLAIGTAITGLCYGAVFALFSLATADLYGLKYFGVNYGIVITAWGCAGIIGPLIGGWVVDVTGTYHLAYIIGAVLLMIAAIVVLTFKVKMPES